ncbi:hypothetical protein FRC12_018237 [Ceratobasidium sp. 428]|nr:hypothetical protein FRC12_018237 [Ceratobasidium sp. 428]
MSSGNPLFERFEDVPARGQIKELEVDEFLPTEQVGPKDSRIIAESVAALGAVVDDPAQAVGPLTLAQMIADATEAINAYREKIALYQW